jgi:hypothetical protein
VCPEEPTVKKRVWPSLVISSSCRSGHEGNKMVVRDSIDLLSQQGRKDDGEVLFYFITFELFTQRETEPFPTRILQTHHETSRRFGTGVLKSKRKERTEEHEGKKGGISGKANPPEGY